MKKFGLPSPTCSQRIPKLPGGSALRKGRADRRELLRRGFSRDAVEKSRGPCFKFSPSNPRSPCSPRSCQPGHLHFWSKIQRWNRGTLLLVGLFFSLTPSHHHHPHPCILQPLSGMDNWVDRRTVSLQCTVRPLRNALVKQ